MALKFCKMCGSPTVEDGESYHESLPSRIYKSYDRLYEYYGPIRNLTDRFNNLVKIVHLGRQAKLKLFPEIEQELTILQVKISEFIDHLRKFDSEAFSMIKKRLESVNYLRFVSLKHIEITEELLSALDTRFDNLKQNINKSINNLELEFKKVEKKTDYIIYHWSLLKKIHRVLPSTQEELIAIIPRINVRINNGLIKKYTLVFTTNNLYFLREKGLFNVRIKLDRVVSLFSFTSPTKEESFFFGEMLQFRTNTDIYKLIGRKKVINELPTYFEIKNNYIDYNISNIKIIEKIRDQTVPINLLKRNNEEHMEFLKGYLLNKREVRTEIRRKDSKRVIIDNLRAKLLENRRRIMSLIQRRKTIGNTRKMNELLRSLMMEQSRLDTELNRILSNQEFESYFNNNL